MYYPFLRARQFELIALRELAIEGITQAHIRPILEPVKESFNNLELAYNIFKDKGQRVYLVLNPENGQQTGDITHYSNYIKGKEEVFSPAFFFKENSDNAKYIKEIIIQNKLGDCMLLCSNEIDSHKNDFVNLSKMEEITSFNVEDPGRNRTLARYIKGLKKGFIRRDDLFEAQARNSDFLKIEEHLFSEEHLYFEEDNFTGFSDYTLMPNEYNESGSTPRAVVIHFSYLGQNEEFRIRHFTSETNDSISNVQGKFAEACEKAVNYFKTHKLSNSAIDELTDYFYRQHYPGLGIVKKISLKNHINLVSDYLKTKY